MKHPLVACLFALAAIVRAAPPATAPNIVFIFSDDHAYQAISAYGDGRKLIETPNIDRLAKQGMRLDRCLVTNSICGPSRATILTGKYNHLNGFVNNSNSARRSPFPSSCKRPATRRRSSASGTLAPIRPDLIFGRSSRAKGSIITRP